MKQLHRNLVITAARWFTWPWSFSELPTELKAVTLINWWLVIFLVTMTLLERGPLAAAHAAAGLAVIGVCGGLVLTILVNAVATTLTHIAARDR